LVEHDLSFVLELCSLVYVLDYGQLIAAGSAEEIRGNPDVQRAYLGSDPEQTVV
jgi:branched-chain amino acid transport system ATP-binding protein